MYTSKQTTVNLMIAKWVINDSSEGLSHILLNITVFYLKPVTIVDHKLTLTRNIRQWKAFTSNLTRERCTPIPTLLAPMCPKPKSEDVQIFTLGRISTPEILPVYIEFQKNTKNKR